MAGFSADSEYKECVQGKALQGGFSLFFRAINHTDTVFSQTYSLTHSLL